MRKRHNIRTVYLRRKREGKTNYKKRLKLLVSKKLRFVYRISSRNINLQLVEFHTKGDKILMGVGSQHLRKAGWKYSGTSMPAAYLVGYLLGKRAVAKGHKEAILDLGLCHHKTKSRIYAAVKGAQDAGLLVPASKEVLPSEDRLAGKHISAYAEQLQKDNTEEYKKRFSGNLKRGADTTKIPQAVEEVKSKLN